MSLQAKRKVDIQAEVKELMTQANQQIKQFETSVEQRKEFFNFMSEMYNYSPRNQMLIRSQYQGALAVAPFSYWKKEGVSVRKGEKGIKILSPRTVSLFKDANGRYKQLAKATTNEKLDIQLGRIKTESKTYFAIGHVFDITQTNAKAENYPELYPNRPYQLDHNDPKQLDNMKTGLLDVARELNIPVYMSQKEVPQVALGAAKGAFFIGQNNQKGIVLSDRLSVPEQLGTLTHELAHAALHDHTKAHETGYWSTHQLNGQRAENVKELQAEMVSYVVNKHHGLDTSAEAINYMASWTKGIEDLDQNSDIFKDIQSTSRDFIQKVDASLTRHQAQTKANKISQGALTR